MHYNASIGKSFYKVPYTKDEDLPIIKELCRQINSSINIILSTDKNMTNEQALFLALLNVFYEHNSSGDLEDKNLYTKSDLLQVIHFLQNNIMRSAG